MEVSKGELFAIFWIQFSVINEIDRRATAKSTNKMNFLFYYENIALLEKFCIFNCWIATLQMT